MSLHYILDDQHIAIPVDLLTWARWFDANHEQRVVARTAFADGTVVSTVFLGLDHAFLPGEPREIFETMVFTRGPLDNATERYATWAQAEAGHAAMVRRVRDHVTSA